MNEVAVYSLVALIVGAVLTWLIFHFIVLSKYREVEQELNKEQQEVKAQLEVERKAKEEINLQQTRLQSELEFAEKQLLEQKQELAQLNEKLTKEFENIASKVVQQNSRVLQERHEEKLVAMLNPFKESIEKFEQKVEKTHSENIRENQSLKEQLLQLKELNKSIGEEAKNLTSALKGDKKLQGDWGEQKLERILQAAGLQKETHYKKQMNLKDDTDANLRPDYVVFLPDDKNLVIDSKVSLVAYEKYFSSEDDLEMKAAVATHLKNLRDHIAGLSAVNYSELHGINSPDYVIMYIPIDGALGLAMTEDPSIFEYALSKNIVLVSNNTLLATLKTVSFIWRQDLQNKNALEIARLGGAMYDKLAGFVETMTAVGKRMESAQEEYRKAMGQLYSGKGNLVRRAEQLKELGARAKKSLPTKLVDRSEGE
jgi:DNA recombination protein RmuC